MIIHKDNKITVSLGNEELKNFDLNEFEMIEVDGAILFHQPQSEIQAPYVSQKYGFNLYGIVLECFNLNL